MDSVRASVVFQQIDIVGNVTSGKPLEKGRISQRLNKTCGLCFQRDIFIKRVFWSRYLNLCPTVSNEWCKGNGPPGH